MRFQIYGDKFKLYAKYNFISQNTLVVRLQRGN